MTTPTSPQPTLREYLQVRRANLARFKRVQLFEIFDRTVLDHLPVRLSKCDRYSNLLTPPPVCNRRSILVLADACVTVSRQSRL